MTVMVPNSGEVLLLSFALGVEVPNDIEVKLYINDYVPVDTSTTANFTQMSTHGYNFFSLTGADWMVSSVAGVATATQPEMEWIFTTAPPVSVYGYYVVDSVSQALVWAERFGSPKTVQYAGDTILITPVITLSRV